MTETTGYNVMNAGCLFYDGECPLCRDAARRAAGILNRHGIDLRPLQSPGAREMLGLRQAELLRETRLLLADGRSFGGADAVLEIARRIWWASPLWLLSLVPGAKSILRSLYRVIAANRHCVDGVCKLPVRTRRAGRPHHRHSAFLELP